MAEPITFDGEFPGVNYGSWPAIFDPWLESVSPSAERRPSEVLNILGTAARGDAPGRQIFPTAYLEALSVATEEELWDLFLELPPGPSSD